jgi:hypothetical protein
MLTFIGGFSMRKMFSVLSLFAVCLCLSCFTGVKQAGAFSIDTLFTQDVKVKYGGAGIAVTPTPYPCGVVVKNIIDGTDEYGDSQATFSSGTLCQYKLESVIDAAVRLKTGDGIVYSGTPELENWRGRDPTSPIGRIILVGGPRAGCSGNGGLGYHSSA